MGRPPRPAKPCAFCAAPFHGHRNEQRYCSNKCSRKDASRRTAVWRLANPEKAKRLRQGEGLKRLYGMTRAQHEAMQLAQGKRCAMCGRLESQLSYKRLAIDHDHVTRQVRGLLCHRCNVGLRYVEDQEFREMALRYLARGTAFNAA